MFDDILFPTDGGEGAARATEDVLALAERHDATVHALSVADTTHESVVRVRGDVVDVLEGAGKKAVAAVAEAADQRGVQTVRAVRRGVPAEVIADYAAGNGMDLIVMPTHGREGLERLLLGSTTERVVRRSTVPVLTLGPADELDFEYPFESVLVPTDGSPGSHLAVDEGAALATEYDAALHLLSIVSLAGLGPDVRSEVQRQALEESAERLLREAGDRARDAGRAPDETIVEYGGTVAGAIEDYVVEHDVDVLVVGTHGRTGLDRYMLGSVTEALVRSSPVPVMTVQVPDEDDA